MEAEELKRFDDTPTTRLKNLEEKVLGEDDNNIIIKMELSKLSKLSKLRRHAPKTPTMLVFREPLYTNFKVVLRRVHPSHTVISMLECLMEAYVEAFGRYANAKVTLFEPLPPAMGDVESMINRAEEGELIEDLEICLKMLARNPEDLEVRRKLRRLMITHRDLLSSTRNREILNLIKKAGAYL